MNPFNIRRIGSEDIPQELQKPGLISILGNPDVLNPHASKIFGDIIDGIDIKSTFHHYDVRIKEFYPALENYLEANVICPLPNPITGYTEFVVALADPNELGLASVAVMKEVENVTRQYYEQILALFTLGASSELRGVIIDWLSTISQSAPKGRISFRGRNNSSIGDSKSYGAEECSRPVSKKITEKQIREVYDNLPDRYSELYAKRNPEAAAILKFSLELMDPSNNMVHLLLEAAKVDRNLLKKLHNTKIRIASQYSIRLKKWSKDQEKYFNDTYRYCLYVVDNRGNEKPIKFQNRPSYCIYLMYVLDRYNKHELVTDLAYKDNQREFKKLYSEIMLEDFNKIDSCCNTMLRRENPETGVFRKGRYDDYIKDISDTFDNLVGSPDSMVFKVGHGQFLQILPSKIEIDENLPKFAFV